MRKFDLGDAMILVVLTFALYAKVQAQNEFGALQFEDTRFRLDTRSLEKDDKTWPLFIDATVDDKDRVCMERYDLKGKRSVTKCKTFGELRQWLR